MPVIWFVGKKIGCRHTGEQTQAIYLLLGKLQSSPFEVPSAEVLKRLEEHVIGEEPTSEISSELFSLVPHFSS